MKCIVVLFIGFITSCKLDQKSQPLSAQQHVHREWMLIAYDTFSKSTLISQQAGLNLSQKEQGSANMGCNHIGFRYQMSGGKNITLDQMIMTEMACESMILEQKFGMMAQGPLEYVVGGHHLTLIGKGRDTMKFVAKDWD